ncbi:molybdopterin-binding protein [Streptomyces sp. NPDC049577]|uniref:molybdopterin-binding protein n=1 Tax=Streptomyces sp. NPDC049577 TaxID=3155153 RepID=UPI00342E14F5
MTDHDADAALERATEEALALLTPRPAGSDGPPGRSPRHADAHAEQRHGPCAGQQPGHSAPREHAERAPDRSPDRSAAGPGFPFDGDPFGPEEALRERGAAGGPLLPGSRRDGERPADPPRERAAAAVRSGAVDPGFPFDGDPFGPEEASRERRPADVTLPGFLLDAERPAAQARSSRNEPPAGSGFSFDRDPFGAAPEAAGGRSRGHGGEGPEEPLDVPFDGVRFVDLHAPERRRKGTGGPRHGRVPWDEARHIAARAADVLPAERLPIAEALGRTLAEPLAALADLPSFDTSAMDGWALAGPGPWQLPGEGEDGTGILAGQDAAAPLADGRAVPIATGARVPPGTTAVLRREHGRTGPQGELQATRRVTQGQDIRPRAQECRRGDELLPAGMRVNPAVLGLAAATGYDELAVTRRPRVDVLVLGDELLREGTPRDGLIRDALGPMLGPWLDALGAEVRTTRHLGDDAEALHAALAGSEADLVLTTGGTASGPVDHVRPALGRLGAELLVDGVAVRPGHPMLLARLAPGRHLVGLPGNPLAAVAGLVTLAVPVLRALAGQPPADRLPQAVLTGPVSGHPADTRLVPVTGQGGGRARPLRFHGPAMLRGLAAADALAVIPPGGTGHGGRAELLALPWAAAAPAGGAV